MNQYPGTNFHDLNLNWLLNEMKNCLTEWASTKEDWEDLETDNAAFKERIESEWDSFEDYVRNYLTNLDVSQEINAKIDAMIESGQFRSIIINDVVGQTALTTASWLNSHITQETGYVIDDTLTVSGAAADAKAAGDRITELKNAIDYIAPVRCKDIFNDFSLGFFNNNTLYTGSGGYLAVVEMQNGAKYDITATGTYNRFAVAAGNTYATNVSIEGRTNQIVSSPNKMTYTNTSNYKYLFVWLNSGTTDFDCTCTIYETVGNPDALTLNGISIKNGEQTEKLTANKAVAYKTAKITNLLTNGDFHTASTPIQVTNATAAVSDGVLTATGNGGGDTIKAGYYYEITDISQHHLTCGMWIRSNSEGCKKISLRLLSGRDTPHIVNPVKDKWYYIQGRYVGSYTDNVTSMYSVWAEYADATAENGKSISIKEACAYYINTDFGLGVDPPLYQLMKIHDWNGFWLGEKEVTIWKAEEAVTNVPEQKWSFAQKHRPVVTFVDDDGWYHVYNELSPISEKYNVPMVSAIQINSAIHDYCGLRLQNELGWEMAVHPSCGNGGLATLETEAEIEEYLVDTNAYLDERGYKWKNVVYADGEPDERVRRLAKKYYRCGAVGSLARINQHVIANFEICRIPIGYPMGSDWNTFNNLKQFIDQAVENNGWCVFMLHCGMTEHHTATITEIVDQLVDYAKNTCGIDILTLDQGFNIFGNALECGDYTGRNSHTGANPDDPTEGIAISQTGELGNIVNIRTMNNLLTTLGTACGGTFTATYDDTTGAYTFTFTAGS